MNIEELYCLASNFTLIAPNSFSFLKLWDINLHLCQAENWSHR